MQRLTYKEYKGNKDILLIDLHNGYTVIAIKLWNSDKHKYIVELRIKENTIEKWDLIEKAEALEFHVDYKIINKAILKQVSNFLSEGFFHYYIDRYEYENKCIEKGNEIYENEILDEKSNKPIKDKTIYGIIYHCPNCRNEIDTENKYCPYCKSLLNWSEIE